MSMSNLKINDLKWRKARRSANNGACVELAPVSGQILVRDSMDPEGPVLTYPVHIFRSFLDIAKKDAFPR